MATLSTKTANKLLRHRGLYSGKEQSVTGVLRVTDGQSIATTDVINALRLGENVRPTRVIVMSTRVSGTPVLTNPTFNVGVAPVSADTYERPDGTEYAPVPTDADIISAALVIGADGMKQDVEVARPIATADYAPYFVTLTPAGAGAFSVAGGVIDLAVTVVFNGEESAADQIYTEYVNQKVSNDA